jgi:hypothetical protein
MVVPEDPILDQYILKPVVEQLFVDLGRRARVQVLSKPRLRGVDQALDAAVLADIVATHRMVDLFLVLIDRDGDPSKRQSDAARREREHPNRLLVCFAVEEVEVWMLALYRDRLQESWSEVRAEPHPKERFAAPFLERYAPKLSLGGGRAWAMRQLGTNWKGVLAVCPELVELTRAVAKWISTRGANASDA